MTIGTRRERLLRSLGIELADEGKAEVGMRACSLEQGASEVCVGEKPTWTAR